MMAMAAMMLMLFLIVVMVAMAAVVLMLHLCKVLSNIRLALHGIQKLLSGQLTPRSRDQSGLGVVLAQQRHSSIQLGLRNGIGAGQDDGGGGFDLIVVELTKVLHVDLDLARVRNGDSIAQHHIVSGDLLHSSDHVGQLAHAGGLDDDSIRMVLADDLLQRLAEITHQTAANAAGVHFGNVNAGILQKAAINADLTEFVLDQHQLLAPVGFLNHFFDQRGLAGSQKAGINIDLCHRIHLLYIIVPYIIPPNAICDK